MRRLTLALLFASLVALPTQHAYAQADQPDPCPGYAAQMALPALLQSYQYSPQGSMNVAMTGEMQGDAMAGMADVAGMGQMEWSAKRSRQ